MVKLVNGETHGMFILSAEPKELTIVLILGPVRMEDLGKLHGLSGLGALGDVPGVQNRPHGKSTYKDKDKDKTTSEKDKDGDQ
jgi:hypothetical protein